MIIILFLKIIIISIKKKKKIKILILILGNLKFPYLVYFEKIEGNSNNNDDAISNRFILKKLRNEIYTIEIKKILKRTFNLYRLYSDYNKNNKRNNNLSWSIENNKRNNSGINNNSYRGKKSSIK